MAASLWTTGACHFYLKVVSSTLRINDPNRTELTQAFGSRTTTETVSRNIRDFAYLGTCEGSPNFDILPQYKECIEDQGGEAIGPQTPAGRTRLRSWPEFD